MNLTCRTLSSVAKFWEPSNSVMFSEFFEDSLIGQFKYKNNSEVDG